MKSGIVHKLTCSCGFTYIGQTRSNLLSKIKDHVNSEKSEVCKYLLQNPTHRVDFNTPTILGSKNDTARLLILESLFTHEQTPGLNNDFQSNPRMIFNTQLNSYCVSPTLHHNFLIFHCHVTTQT